MKSISFPFIMALLLSISGIKAQQGSGSKQKNIIDAVTTTDSETHATVSVYQDKRIEELLNSKRNSGSSRRTASGFRVQVFSSNIQRTAKSEAFNIEKQIREEFPDEAVYVNYISPFWKVRVGDFKTQAQAQAFRSQLITAFPQMRSEIYIVREQISLTGTK